MTSTMTIEIEDHGPDRADSVAYQDGAYYVRRERSQFTGSEYCFVYKKVGYERLRQSDATTFSAAVALIEHLQKEDERRAERESRAAGIDAYA